MGPQSTQRALLNLERSSAPPTELLDEAARILGKEFAEIRDDLFSASEETSSRKTAIFAAREDWTLRWLLKKTKSAATSSCTGPEAESSANDDPRKWLLFYHLVQKTPVKRIAKSLRDHDAMQQIQAALIRLDETQKLSPPVTGVNGRQHSTSRDSEDDEYESPQGESKKRKRSSGVMDPLDKDSSSVQVIFSILQSLKICLDHSLAVNGEDPISQQHMRIALSLAPESVAIFLQYVFRNVHSILGNMTQSSLRNDLLILVQDTSRLWGIRRGPDLGHTADESNEVFTLRCLLPGLSLLKFMRDSELRDQYKDFEAWVAKVIAQHAVEPARRVFFDELASNWKSDQDPLLPEQIKPAIDRLQNLLFHSSKVDSSLVDGYAALSHVAPILLELAIRSCPRSTVRKAQHEQPWLEAVLVYLAHIGGCSLIDSGDIVSATGAQGVSSQSVIEGTGPPSPRSLTCLDGLLSTAIQWELSLSLPLLSSLAQKFSGLRQLQIVEWAVVAKLMQLDVNVFLPNSGISGAKELLDQLMENLNHQSNILTNKNDLGLDLHLAVKLVTTVMEGFASARDLGTYVNMWMKRLTTVADDRSSRAEAGQPIYLYSLWEDENITAEFARVAKTFATPNFIISHLTATTQALRDKNHSGKHYALVTVLDILVTTHKEEIESAEDNVMLLYDELQNALQTKKASGRLEGLLWRLIRHIFPLVRNGSPFVLFKDLVEDKEKAIIETAMQNANANGGPAIYTTSMLNFNEIERFHCFVVMAALVPAKACEYMDREINSLTQHFVELGSGHGNRKPCAMQLWDGRFSNMESSLDLLAAFLGILLQNSHVLCRKTENTVVLLKALALYIAGEGQGRSKTRSRLVDLFEGLVLDEALVSTPGFVKKCVEATGLLNEAQTNHTKMAIIQALPKEAMSKMQRKHIAEWQRGVVAASKQKDIDPVHSERELAHFQGAQQGVAHPTKDMELLYGDLQQSCREARGAAVVQSREDVISLCESLRKESPGRATFLLLGSMLNKGDTISQHVTKLAADLSILLPKSTSLENFCLTADCLKLILEKHHKSVNQYTIDTLLAHIAITASLQGPKILPTAAPIIFERLCHLLAIILARYRIRLGGRYHLLLPALSNLLHCLFASNPNSLTTQSQLLFHSKLPPWIHSYPTKLSKDSATHLTRLLTSICDPTPSSVKMAHNSLTDETKKARSIAGQYMQYFIAEYAHCQLHGRIQGEAKAALMPGLYAVLDVMGREVMRGMNAKMDASQKAIWRGLYEDYGRFGRWNGM